MIDEKYCISTPIGTVLVTMNLRGIKSLSLSTRFHEKSSQRLPTDVKKLKDALLNYFDNKMNAFNHIHIDTKDLTPFQLKITRILRRIPFGQVISYEALGRRAGYQRAARAVGNVMRRNPWPILVPCHRVLRSNGELGGYSLGISVKKRLLEIEGVLK